MGEMLEVDYERAIASKYPEPVALAVSMDHAANRPNIITLGWSMCTSHSPPMLAISVGHTRHSLKTISDAGEFVLAFPSAAQAEAALFCGTSSGRDVDKFAETGLEPLRALKVEPPLVADACANFECRVVDACESGDHRIFIGRVVASHLCVPTPPRLYTLGDGSLGPVSRRGAGAAGR